MIIRNDNINMYATVVINLIDITYRYYYLLLLTRVDFFDVMLTYEASRVA